MFLYLIKNKNFNGYILEVHHSLEEVEQGIVSNDKYELTSYGFYKDNDYCWEVKKFIFDKYKFKINDGTHMVLNKFDINIICKMIGSFRNKLNFEGYVLLNKKLNDKYTNMKQKKYFKEAQYEILGVKESSNKTKNFKNKLKYTKRKKKLNKYY